MALFEVNVWLTGNTLKASYAHNIDAFQSVGGEVTKPLNNDSDVSIALGYSRRLVDGALAKAKLQNNGTVSLLYQTVSSSSPPLDLLSCVLVHSLHGKFLQKLLIYMWLAVQLCLRQLTCDECTVIVAYSHCMLCCDYHWPCKAYSLLWTDPCHLRRLGRLYNKLCVCRS